MIDLLVAGGGPAGLGTAIEAAQAGLKVAVFEPRTDPVDKACGEGLMPSAVSALHRLGVHPEGRELAGIRYLEGRHRAEARFPARPGLGVRRTELAARLARRAEELGVDRVRRRAGEVRQDADGVTVAGVRASWLAVADGLHSPLRRGLGLDAVRRGPARFGLRRHYAVAPWTDLIEVHWSGDAEAYVTPVAPGLVGVAVLCPGGGVPYEQWLTRFPALAERLAGADGGPVRGAGPLRRSASSVARGRALLVGDAAGYVDALTGEGVAVGLAGGRALVECLLAGRPGDYPAAWAAATRRYRTVTSTLLWVRHRRLGRACIVRGAQRSPRAFATVVAALA